MRFDNSNNTAYIRESLCHGWAVFFECVFGAATICA